MATSFNIKEYFYDKGQVDQLLTGKSNTNHTHSQYLTDQSLLNYLTSEQINTLLSSYALTNSLSAVALSGSYNDLINKPSIPSKTSDLTNDSGFVLTNDSRLSDARTPTSHSHGNIGNDGTINGNVADYLPYIKILGFDAAGIRKVNTILSSMVTHNSALSNINTATDARQSAINTAIDTKIGEINTSLTNKANLVHSHLDTDVYFDDNFKNVDYSDTALITDISNVIDANGEATQSDINGLIAFMLDDKADINHTHDNVGGVVTVEKQTTAESGYIATYVVKQGGTQVGTKINIPKDFLVKSATIGTSTAANSPQAGFAKGDKYLDFVINTKDSSATDEHLYVNVKDLFNEYTADETTLTLSNGEFSIKSGVIPSANTTASNIKMNGTQSAGSATTYAKADHVHPTDTSRAAASHSHGSITNDGKVGTAANKPLITGTGGLVQAGSFGTSANTFAEGNHTHSQYLTSHQDVSNKLEFADLEDMIGLEYDPDTGVLSLTFTDN